VHDAADDAPIVHTPRSGLVPGSSGSIAAQAASSSQYSAAIVSIQAVTVSLNQKPAPDP